MSMSLLSKNVEETLIFYDRSPRFFPECPNPRSHRYSIPSLRRNVDSMDLGTAPTPQLPLISWRHFDTKGIGLRSSMRPLRCYWDPLDRDIRLCPANHSNRQELPHFTQVAFFVDENTGFRVESHPQIHMIPPQAHPDELDNRRLG